MTSTAEVVAGLRESIAGLTKQGEEARKTLLHVADLLNESLPWAGNYQCQKEGCYVIGPFDFVDSSALKVRCRACGAVRDNQFWQQDQKRIAKALAKSLLAPPVSDGELPFRVDETGEWVEDWAGEAVAGPHPNARNYCDRLNRLWVATGRVPTVTSEEASLSYKPGSPRAALLRDLLLAIKEGHGPIGAQITKSRPYYLLKKIVDYADALAALNRRAEQSDKERNGHG